MTPTQIVIIAISIVLTALFIALGIQMWFILKELRGSVIRVNKILDDSGKVSGVVSDGFTNVNGLMNGLKSGLSLVTSLKGKGGTDE